MYIRIGILLALLARPGIAAPCGDPGTLKDYREPKYGIGFSYPSSFAVVPGSEGEGTVRLETADRLSSATFTFLPNTRRETPAALHREAQQDITQNSHGSISFQQAGEKWFVISGNVAGRIYYRRTILIRGNSIIANMWIEFPAEYRPCMNNVVSMMARSFR